MIRSGEKILITGASGFVGSHMSRRLVRDGYKVHALIRPSSLIERIRDIAPQLNFHRADLRDADSVKKIIESVKPRGIFHLAASTLASGRTAPLEELVPSNILGTINLINAVQKIDYDFFIHTGSFTEYGLKLDPLRESDRCEPPEIYSITKLASTLFAKEAGRGGKKPIVTLRLFTPYGPWIQPGRLVGEIISKALAGEDIVLTRPEVTRDFIFVEDIISLYLEAAKRAREYGGEIFNLGSGRKTSIGELVDLILRRTGSQSALRWGEFRQVSYDSDTWQADMNKTFSSFHWRPLYTLEKGIEATIKWFRDFS